MREEDDWRPASVEEIDDVSEMAATAIMIASRLLNWVAGRTVLRGAGKDLVTTPREAKRIARPLTRYALRRFEIDGTTLTERRDLIRIGLATGSYGARAAVGEPGGAFGASAESAIDASLSSDEELLVLDEIDKLARRGTPGIVEAPE